MCTTTRVHPNHSIENNLGNLSENINLKANFWCKKSEIASELFQSSNPNVLSRRVFCKLMFLITGAGYFVEFFIRAVPEKQLLKSLKGSIISTCREF